MRTLLPTLLLLAVLPTAVPAPVSLEILYPLPGSVFPPEMPAPLVLWRDSGTQKGWRIAIEFQDGGAPLEAFSDGPAPPVGLLDPRAVAPTNEPPRVEAGLHSWRPAPAMWEEIKRRSLGRVAVLKIGRGSTQFTTSTDPVGAPVFYRDVPLMPSETRKGVIQPLAPDAIRLVEWRLRDIARTESRVVLRSLPACANCHSFSADGRTLGMDLDGPDSDKGTYAIAPVGPKTVIRREDVFTWNSFAGRNKDARTIGFMSQVSPDGQHVVSTVNEEVYTANFRDYRFLQVFYPTRGILAVYSRATGRIQPLPGADDPRYVHTNAVWSPDGRWLVFARAEARDAYPPGRALAAFAGSPDETPLRYDLYRIPFNGGRGGRPEPIAGASANGRSNSFPKVSPDGRWLVYVQSANGQLMRPDSQLHIVPFAGGSPRRMACNTPRMNSWHSFSPNGRWMVFSSKSRSPYTQLFLTHIDEQGRDTPAVLIENTTAANRAANIPEFVNIAPGAAWEIDVPAAEFHRLYDEATAASRRGDYAAAEQVWRRALALEPDDERALNNLGVALAGQGRQAEAAERFASALARKPAYGEARENLAAAHYELGRAAAREGRLDEAAGHLERALALNEALAEARFTLASLEARRGHWAASLEQWKRGLRLRPEFVPGLKQAAWILATAADASLRDGALALQHGSAAVRLAGPGDAEALDAYAAACAETGRFQEAASAARQALAVAPPAMQAGLRRRLASYESGQPWREAAIAGAARGPL